MTENISAEMLLRILDRLPGSAWASRIDLAKMKAEWLYMGPQVPALYDVSEEELRRDPFAVFTRIVPEDAARLDAQMRASIAELSAMSWTGRVVRASGEVRWLESQTVYERDADGTILAYGQVLDVTEQKQADRLHRAVIDALPIGVSVSSPDGRFLLFNPEQKKGTGGVPADADPALMRSCGVYQVDGVTPFAEADRPTLLTLTDGKTHETEMVVKNSYLPAPIRLHVRSEPLRDETGKVFAGLTITQNITEQRRLEDELRTRNAELAESEEAKTALIDRLRYAIDELSNPILEVWDDVLAMPIIGVVDSRRTADMVQRLLAEVARTQASFVIVDLTGVELVDTKTADYLMKLIRKVELIGARCVLTGIRPAVAETLVDIGVDFGKLTTLRNLKHGLREALRFARREREGLRSLRPDEGQEEGDLEAVARKR